MTNISLNILLIEDEPISAGIIKKFLKETHLPHNISHYKKGYEAQEVFKKHHYDLIILDYLLQDTDGFSLLKYFRNIETRTPIIILTGKGNENIAAKMIKNGADDYLIKSQINGEIFKEVILNVVDQRQKKCEEHDNINQIQEKALYLDSLIQNSLGSIVLIDSNGNFKFYHNVKSKNLFGLSNEGIKERNIFEYVEYEYLEKLKKALNVLMPGEQKNLEIKINTPLKGELIIYLKINNQNHNTILGGYVINAFDITIIRKSQKKIKEYYERLKKAYKELDEFTYIVAHDLKSPINWVNKINQFIEEDIENENWEELKHHQQMMNNSISKMENLISGVWDYSRSVSDKTGNKEQTDINNLLKYIENNLKITYDFHLNIPDLIPMVETNKTQIEQIFYNLLINAINHNDKETTVVTIQYEITGNNQIKFIVKDNGPGIAQKHKDKIYNMFFTLKEDELKQYNRGIGLTIVKKLIDKNNENIWFHSENEKGTTFYFTWHIYENKKKGH